MKEISRIAAYIDARVADLSGRKNQAEIVEEAGLTSHNLITMMKKGHTKVPIDRVAGLAKALECDQNEMMRLALEQFYSPSALKDLESAFGGAAVTDNERELLRVFREATNMKDPRITAEIREKIAGVFKV